MPSGFEPIFGEYTLDELRARRDDELTVLLANLSTLVFALEAVKVDTMQTFDDLQSFLITFDRLQRALEANVTLLTTMDYELYQRAKQMLDSIIDDMSAQKGAP